MGWQSVHPASEARLCSGAGAGSQYILLVKQSFLAVCQSVHPAWEADVLRAGSQYILLGKHSCALGILLVKQSCVVG